MAFKNLSLSVVTHLKPNAENSTVMDAILPRRAWKLKKTNIPVTIAIRNFKGKIYFSNDLFDLFTYTQLNFIMNLNLN